MNILGLSCYYHDSAVALLVDGELIAAAEEERFSRKKHDNGFPVHAINFCLGRAGINPRDIDYVAFYEKPLLKADRSLKILMETFPRSLGIAPSILKGIIGKQFGLRNEISTRLNISPDQIFFIEHHLSHAASAFFCSPFQNSAILTIDGVGEWATASLGCGSALDDQAGRSSIKIERELHFPHSLGMLYSAFTQFLGFEVNEGEYRVMGLAPYGKPRYLDKVEKVVAVQQDGSLRLNMEYFDFLTSRKYTYSQKFIDLFGQPNRDVDSTISSYYADVAASIQAKTEEIILKMVEQAHRVSGSRNLCLAGGVALNSVANGRISRDGPFDNIFIQPAAGDSGCALGAALYTEHQILARPRKFTMEHAYLGQDYTDGVVADTLNEAGVDFETVEDEDLLANRVAQMLDGGQVVGWFQGRFEWGPRALGARSILADPRPSSMKDTINAKVKFREPFRPFAPAILENKITDFFDFDPRREPYPSRFMLTVHPFHDEKGPLVGAVNHAGTGRLQSVSAEYNPRYYRLIQEFAGITGIPLILNTSFNLRGEPIVNSPQNALATFKNSGIDALVLGPHLIQKSAVKGLSGNHKKRNKQKSWKHALYSIAPQMKDYQDMALHPIPYLGFIQQPQYQTKTLNTDDFGFRYTQDRIGVLNSKNWGERSNRGIILGGSAAFGVGATSDKHTISSVLSTQTQYSFLNLGIRSANSTQEFIAALPFINKAERIIVYTGNNTLLACMQNIGHFDIYAPLFQEETLAAMTRLPLRFYRQMIKHGCVPDSYLDDLKQNSQELRFTGPPTLGQAVEKALEIQCRDLGLLHRLCGNEREMAVIIQPFALTAKQELSSEEARLFNLLFESKKESYALNKQEMIKLWPGYVQSLINFCRKQDIPVMDANELEFNGWCFIDPVHMTDHGYAIVANRIAGFLK